jgi:NitT/TauT family transport system permease protein
MAEQTRELIVEPKPAPLSPAKRGEGRWRNFLTTALPPMTLLVVLLVVWEIYIAVRNVPLYIFPPPSAIFRELFERPEYFLVENGALTFFEAVAGFFVGALTAIVVAAVMARSRLIERTFFPLALVIKATPLVVIAPLLIIWFGYSMTGKIIMAALICFFPILVNTIVGLRSVNANALEFFESVSASEWEIFTKLRAPSALPYVLAAFKISISLAVIGAIVAEWAGASVGLGRVILLASNDFNQPAVFAGVLVLAVMGISLTAIVSWLERRFLYWHESEIVG